MLRASTKPCLARSRWVHRHHRLDQYQPGQQLSGPMHTPTTPTSTLSHGSSPHTCATSSRGGLQPHPPPSGDTRSASCHVLPHPPSPHPPPPPQLLLGCTSYGYGAYWQRSVFSFPAAPRRVGLSWRFQHVMEGASGLAAGLFDCSIAHAAAVRTYYCIFSSCRHSGCAWMVVSSAA